LASSKGFLESLKVYIKFFDISVVQIILSFDMPIILFRKESTSKVELFFIKSCNSAVSIQHFCSISSNAIFFVVLFEDGSNRVVIYF